MVAASIYFTLFISFAVEMWGYELRFYLLYVALIPFLAWKKVLFPRGPFLFFVFFNAFSVIGSLFFCSHELNVRFYSGSFSLLAAYSAFCMGVYISRAGYTDRAMTHVIIAGCMASIVGSFQVLSSIINLQQLYDFLDPIWVTSAVSNAPYSYASFEDLVRGQAFFREPAHLAFYLLPSLTLSWRKKSNKSSFIIILVGFVGTFSISAFTVLMIGLIALFLVNKNFRKYVPFLTASCFVVIFTLYETSASIRVRIDSIVEVISAGQFVYTAYSTSFEALLAGIGTIRHALLISVGSFFFGAGRGNFSLPFESFMEFDEAKINSMPGLNDGGNLCTLIIGENGIIGLGFLVVPFVFLTKRYVKSINVSEAMSCYRYRERSIYISSFILILYNYFRYGGISFVIVWIFLGLAYGQKKLVSRDEE